MPISPKHIASRFDRWDWIRSCIDQGIDWSEVSECPRIEVSGIYMILNTEVGKCYVGSPRNIPKRWREHVHCLETNKGVVLLQRAFNKYGPGAFKFLVIELCEIEDLESREQFWMDSFRSWDRRRGYNLCPIAGSSAGRKLTEDHKRKISESHKGLTHTEETRRKISEIQTGKKQSEETKKKRGEALSGRTLTKEHRENIARAVTGKTHSKDTRRRLSESHLGRSNGPHSEETKKKISETHKKKGELRRSYQLWRKWKDNYGDMRRKSSASIS